MGQPARQAKLLPADFVRSCMLSVVSVLACVVLPSRADEGMGNFACVRDCSFESKKKTSRLSLSCENARTTSDPLIPGNGSDIAGSRKDVVCKGE